MCISKMLLDSVIWCTLEITLNAAFKFRSRFYSNLWWWYCYSNDSLHKNKTIKVACKLDPSFPLISRVIILGSVKFMICCTRVRKVVVIWNLILKYDYFEIYFSKPQFFLGTHHFQKGEKYLLSYNNEPHKLNS